MTLLEAISATFTTAVGSDDNDKDDNNESRTGGSGGRRTVPSRSYEEEREQVLKRLYQGMEVRTRRYRFRNYKSCFVGSEAVDYMVSSGWAQSREDAVTMGRYFQQHFNLFEHVVAPQKHPFKDAYLFYRFVDIHSSSSSALLEDSTSRRSSSGAEYDDEWTDLDHYQSASLVGSKKLGLKAVGGMLYHSLERVYNFSLDMEGFYANDAVDYMLSVGLATTRRDAVCIGVALQRTAGIIVNVKTMHDFADEKIFFSFKSEPLSNWFKELQETRDSFTKNMRVYDHTYRLKTYKNTFTGTEAVEWLLLHGATAARQDAVLLGRAMAVEFNLFGHVTGEHLFEDSEFFYRFSKPIHQL